MTCESDDKIAIDFIDPLFAVVLNVSFAQICIESWFADWHLIVREPNLFNLGTLFLGYLTVVLSWVGYHRSVRRCQIHVESWAGRGRFYLDILLLVLYFVLLSSYKNFQRDIWVLVFVFLLYWGWDQFKCVECPEIMEKDLDKRSESTARRGVTVFWFLVFLALALFYRFYPPSVRCGCEDWIVLFTATASTYLYRWHKKHLWWKSLLLTMGFPRPSP